MTEETRSQCFRCDQESYWSQVVWIPVGHKAMSKVTSRRTLDCRLTPCPSRCRDIILRSTNLSRLSMDDWRPRLPWPNHYHLWQRSSHYSIGVTHLFPPGHWGHLLGPDGVPPLLVTILLGKGNILTNLIRPYHSIAFLGVLLALICFWWY